MLRIKIKYIEIKQKETNYAHKHKKHELKNIQNTQKKKYPCKHDIFVFLTYNVKNDTIFRFLLQFFITVSKFFFCFFSLSFILVFYLFSHRPGHLLKKIWWPCSIRIVSYKKEVIKLN